MQNADGTEIPQEAHANAMADHFEKKQWYIRPDCGNHISQCIFNENLPVGLDAITRDELKKTIAKLKNNRAAGTDAIPPEIWKALAKDDNALDVFLHLCNQCWMTCKIPVSWHKVSVITIVKKDNIMIWLPCMHSI